MSFRKYVDLFEQHMYFHNMEIGKMMYKLEETEVAPVQQEKDIVYF